ncbi:MAG: hypothetical protein J7545_11595 [Roseofilum sp. SBFL]|uniref:hypothetical protein n=1 Tax=unclassified Roseofilum TaxID=2620099 RepID=UPI001B114C3A|nr:MULTISPECIES: hypothetical protein [unclassified Roseofilum]MBP0013090.1 hypothetical protein [Roseofilum sp. SID3]MBP0023742.1 hypothetical protein [Roseofilum sp. SID2]MBP0036814.1 hypothetical protein [Roseofilum sp. SID1]MBP0042604.1 hypothetical protein [Roseofilum sp. SBFL]
MNLRYRGIQYQRTLPSVKAPEEGNLPESIIPPSPLSSSLDLQTLQLYKTLIVLIVALMAGVASLVT